MAKNKTICEAVMATANDFNKSGLMDDITLREFEALCMPPVKEFSPTAIARLRKKLKLSQAAFAKFLNTSKSTIVKWEAGDKRPSGAALKLLNIVSKNGLAVLV